MTASDKSSSRKSSRPVPEDEAQRAWTGLYRWDDRETFRVGTVFVRVRGTSQEVEAAVEAEFARLWAKWLPSDIRRPGLVGLEPGMLVFVPEDET